MELLCHRGLWGAREEQNTLAAFRAAWSYGWGVETDLRDLDGHVVVSHDLPRRGALALEDLLAAYAQDGGDTALALNVKADGLACHVAELLAEHDVTAAFAFDASVPDSLAWLRAGVPTWTRWSDVERVPALLSRSDGVWLDAFEDDGWWVAEEVRGLTEDLPVCLVSPELHGRDPRPVWDRLAEVPDVWVCTDQPHALTRAVS